MTRAILVHDLFNIFAVGSIVFFNVVYLALATDLSLIGTDQLGAEYFSLFTTYYYLFLVYIIVDTIWISSIPGCTTTHPLPIIIHHVLTFIFALTPYVDKQFAWHMAITLLVEVNTFFLTLKRNVPSTSIIFTILNVLFYLTWISLRLVCFPILVVFFYQEWRRYSKAIGTDFNFILLAPIFQFLITALSFKWTYDMAMKQLFKKRASSKSS